MIASSQPLFIRAKSPESYGLEDFGWLRLVEVFQTTSKSRETGNVVRRLLKQEIYQSHISNRITIPFKSSMREIKLNLGEFGAIKKL